MTVCYRRPAQQLVVKNIFFSFFGDRVYYTSSVCQELRELPDFALLGLKMWNFFFKAYMVQVTINSPIRAIQILYY